MNKGKWFITTELFLMLTPMAFPNMPLWTVRVTYAVVLLILLYMGFEYVQVNGRWKKILGYWKISGLVLFFAFSVGILSWAIIQNNPNYGKKDEISGENPEITIEYLFKTDFKESPHPYFKISILLENGKQYTADAIIIYSFSSNTKFIAYYVPASYHMYQVAFALAKKHDEVFDRNRGNFIELRSDYMQPVHSNELIFSGRIFIYHEFPFTEYQKRDLFNIYKKEGLFVQFRGPKYLEEMKKRLQGG